MLLCAPYVEDVSVSPESKLTAKKRRIPRPKLTTEQLLGNYGIEFVAEKFPKRLKTSCENTSDERRSLKRVIRTYMEWTKLMFPSESFDVVVRKIELLGHRCKSKLTEMRDNEVSRVRMERKKEQLRREDGTGESKRSTFGNIQDKDDILAESLKKDDRKVAADLTGTPAVSSAQEARGQIDDEIEAAEAALAKAPDAKGGGSEDADFEANMGDEYDMIDY